MHTSPENEKKILHLFHFATNSILRFKDAICISDRRFKGQRRIQDRRAGRAPPRFEKNYEFVFVNFDCITRIYFDFSQ